MTTNPVLSPSPEVGSDPRPKPVRSRKRRRTREGGTIDQLKSGRWRVRYLDETKQRHSRTFAKRPDAVAYLTMVSADQFRGQWRDPRLGTEALADYIRRYLASRADLAPTTQQLYARLLTRWIDAPLTYSRPGSPARIVHLGRRHLRSITPSDVREWHTAVLAQASADAQRRSEASRRAAAQRRGRLARLWARQQGYAVSDTGALSAVVRTAWHDAGSPDILGGPLATNADGSPDLPLSREHVGATQARQAYAMLRMILAAAASDGLIVCNPCNLRQKVTTEKAKQRPLPTPEQVEALAAAMPPHMRAAVTVAAWGALRGGELFSLARRHVDLDAGTIRIERTLVEIAGQPMTFGPPKTETSNRLVHLPPDVVDVLREHMSTYTGRGRDALVFTTSKGGPVSTPRRSAAFTKARAAVGCEGITFHDLRHFGATMFARVPGATTKEIQARLGHATFVAAMRYQHATVERDRELASRMNQMNFGPVATVHALREVGA